MTLQDILSGFTGQQQTSGANPAGGATTGYAPQAGGIGSLLSSPLALALLRGYFTAIASPKLSGWGTALGRGGAAAIDQYGLGQYQQQLGQLQQQQAQMRQQQMQQEREEWQTRKPGLEAQTQLQQAKAAQLQEGELYFKLDGHGVARAKPGTPEEKALLDQGYVPQEVFTRMHGGEVNLSPGQRAYETAQGKAAAEAERPMSADVKHQFLDPVTLNKIEEKELPVGEARKKYVQVTEKEAADVREVQNAKATVETLRTLAPEVLTKKEDLGVTGTFGAGISTQADKLYNPEKYARYESELAALAGLPRKFLGGNRMNLTEWNAVMNKLAGTKGYATTAEATDEALQEASTILDRTLKRYSSQYKPEGVSVGTPDQPQATPEAAAAPTPETTSVDVPGLGTIRRIK